MTRKPLIGFICILVAVVSPVVAENALDFALMQTILGNASCATSGCHGGAGPVHGTVADFTHKDPHAKSFATLGTPRSARMAEALGIADPTLSPSCTACHAPVTNVPASRRSPDLRVDEGVGCASCHVSTESWLRTHTRPELSHADKVAAGMRDLRSARSRAEACVACHQVIDARLVEVGRHPRLIFELDGQLASEPPHWREVQGWDGARAWFVGQAVAWREVAAERAAGGGGEGAAERASALAWLVRRAAQATGAVAVDLGGAGGEAGALAAWADGGWTVADGAKALRALAGSAEAFRDAKVSRLEQAYRAERLVLGLDRLLAAWPERARAHEAGPALDKLFAAAQSVPDFNPELFAEALETLSVSVKE
jgi:hypothetical protein